MADEVRQGRSSVRIFPGLGELSRAVALSIKAQISSTLKGAGTFSLVLAGGETPRALYRLLGSEFHDSIPWEQVHLFWGDERYVPSDDSRSNYRLVRENLLTHIAIPSTNIHPISTQFSRPQEAAEVYERVLKSFFLTLWPCFDLVLLGLGADGHTASLFPHSEALLEETRWVTAAEDSFAPPARITLTLPALNHAKQVYFMASGSEKAGALRLAVTGSPEATAIPAARIRPEHGDVVWWADQAAAGSLSAI